jgi:ABC-type sugar transport system, periplasmic component
MRKRWLWPVLLALAVLVFVMFNAFGQEDDAVRIDKATVLGASEGLKEIYLNMPNRPDNHYEAYLLKVPEKRYAGENLVFDLEKEAALSELDEQGVQIDITVPEDGLYALAFTYRSQGENLLQTVLSFEIDGQALYEEMNAVQANNIWVSEGFPPDRYGNETIGMPGRDNTVRQTAYMRTVTGRDSRPLLVYLEQGAHTVSVRCMESALLLSQVMLVAAPEILPAEYAEVQGSETLVIEAEQLARRNVPNIRTAAAYNTALTPYSSSLRVQNFIEDASFRYGGALVEYDIEVPRDGYYNLRFYYRQADKDGFTVFRTLYVDGAVPSDACADVPFAFSRTFTQSDLPAPLYLTAGKHTLGLEVSLDPTRFAVMILTQVIAEMNDLTLDITRITGGNTERFRDFVLTDYGIDVGPMLLNWADVLEKTYAELEKLKSVSGDCGEIKPLEVSGKLLRILAEKPNELPKRLNEFSRGVSSEGSSAPSTSVMQYLTNVTESLQLSQLGLDKMVLYQDAATLPKPMGTLATLAADAERFFYSFGVQEYTPNYSGNKGEAVQIWVNRSRPYLELMQNMLDADFTPKTGIKVELSIVPDQYKLVLANASGKAPDAAVAISSGGVYNLAVRGALADMRAFDNFKEVANRFSPGMLIPGVLDEGLYAIPETFNFWVMFYRSDILENLKLNVPNSMEEVRALLPQLRRMGMNFNSHVSNFVAKPFTVTSPFLFQTGANVYLDGTGLSALSTPEAIEAMTVLTENYNVYSMQYSISSFYQYFRDGRTPIGVSDYGTFNLMTNAAPELAGKWELALYPGITDENGVVQRWTSGAAESNVIFDTSTHKEEAWTFIDWWMSTPVQTEFSFLLQTTMGNEYQWNSANLEALGNAPWNRKHKATIMEQLKWSYDTPRVPGGYMAEREISNAISKVVADGVKLQTAIDAAERNINREIKRKMEEFGYTESGEYTKPFILPTIEKIEGWLK